MSYSSEFKPVRVIKNLFHRHIYWTRLQKILAQGSEFPLQEIDEETRAQDLEQSLTYGNHKSATLRPHILHMHLTKESQLGWIIPLLPEHARILHRATISPMGIVSQSTINERGEVIPSNRITHDLSFPGMVSGESINSRTQIDKLEPCRYGHMLLRCIHYIIKLRLMHVDLPIMLQKTDFKSAYRRVHLNAETATQCMAQMHLPTGEHLVLLPLRLTFGGSACPAEWCIVSEMITDLTNRILDQPFWDPETLAPSLGNQIPDTVILPDDVPYAKARTPMVEVEISKSESGRADVYLDDICTIGVLVDRKVEQRLRFASLLAMETVASPLAPNSNSVALTRDNIVSIDKLHAEAGLSEIKTLLGWEIDTRRLLVKLTKEKHHSWTKEIHDIISAKGLTSKKILESIIGRLNHTASVIPITRHFLSRLYFANSTASKFKPVHLNKMTIQDLKLWTHILEIARSGISMNLLTYRQPDVVYWSDACEYGIGGYSSRGRAWRWKIPSQLQHRAHINLLEFIAELTCIWIDIAEGSLNKEDCVLCFGDSMTAMGWLHRSNFKENYDSLETYNTKTTVARHLAKLVLDHRIKLYSQWLQGQRNGLADALSRDHSTMSDDQLTHHLCSLHS
jgi:hypothetical protein